MYSSMGSVYSVQDINSDSCFKDYIRIIAGNLKKIQHVSFDHVSVYCLQKLKVLFAVGSDGEVSEPLEVDALSCDTVEQVKEKILSTFRAKFGFPYNTPLRDICIGQ